MKKLKRKNCTYTQVKVYSGRKIWRKKLNVGCDCDVAKPKMEASPCANNNHAFIFLIIGHNQRHFIWLWQQHHHHHIPIDIINIDNIKTIKLIKKYKINSTWWGRAGELSQPFIMKRRQHGMMVAFWWSSRFVLSCVVLYSAVVRFGVSEWVKQHAEECMHPSYLNQQIGQCKWHRIWEISEVKMEFLSGKHLTIILSRSFAYFRAALSLFIASSSSALHCRIAVVTCKAIRCCSLYCCRCNCIHNCIIYQSFYYYYYYYHHVYLIHLMCPCLLHLSWKWKFLSNTFHFLYLHIHRIHILLTVT